MFAGSERIKAQKGEEKNVAARILHSIMADCIKVKFSFFATEFCIQTGT